MANYPWASNFLAYAFPCCDCGVCYLTMPTLLVDGSETPYADLTTAQTALTDQVASCLVEQSLPDTDNTVDLFTASFASDTLSIARTDSTAVNPQAAGGMMLFAANITAAGGLAVAYSLTPNATPTFLSVSVDVYAESDLMTLVDSDSDAQADVNSLSGTFNLTVSADGVYQVHIAYGTGPSMNLATELVFTADCTSSGAFSICPVRAAWDDSGTTTYEACA